MARRRQITWSIVGTKGDLRFSQGRYFPLHELQEAPYCALCDDCLIYPRTGGLTIAVRREPLATVPGEQTLLTFRLESRVAVTIGEQKQFDDCRQESEDASYVGESSRS